MAMTTEQVRQGMHDIICASGTVQNAREFIARHGHVARKVDGVILPADEVPVSERMDWCKYV